MRLCECVSIKFLAAHRSNPAAYWPFLNGFLYHLCLYISLGSILLTSRANFKLSQPISWNFILARWVINRRNQYIISTYQFILIAAWQMHICCLPTSILVLSADCMLLANRCLIAIGIHFEFAHLVDRRQVMRSQKFSVKLGRQNWLKGHFARLQYTHI